MLRPGRLGRLNQLQNRRPDTLSGHELVARSLAALGFTWIAGIGGTPVHPILRDCVRMGLRVLGTRTQAGATLMTAAAAYVAGRQTGAVVLSAGPAVTNAITGLLVARDNGWPLLVLGGRRAVPGEPGAFQQLDAATLLQPIAKWTACARTPAEIPHLLHQAVRIARSGRPGPVYVDLPENVLSAGTEAPGPLPPLVVEPAASEAVHVDRLAERMREARRPVLVLGDRTRWHVDGSQVVPWLENLGVPVVSLPLMRGVLAERHPWAVRGTAARARILGQADLVVLLGADLDWRLRFGAEIHRGACLVLVDATPAPPCRLAERLEWLAADPGLLLNQLAQRPAVRGPWGWAPPPLPEPLPEPRPALNRGAVPEGSAAQGACSEQTHPHGLTIREVFAIIRQVLPPEAFLVVDGKITLEAAQRFLERDHPFLYLDPGWNGCMGTGIPFAMAARLHHPDRPLLLVTGDLAFGMGAIELETAVRHQLPFVVLVVNNDGPVGQCNQVGCLPADHPERVHAFQSALAYDALAAGLGFPGCAAATCGDLHHALSTALAGDRPLLINTHVHPFSSATDDP